jgi:glycosyltransferase involved in cell wall biosynthesis
VAVEAMLVGTVVIGSARGATPEIIQHGKTGLLYEWGNVKELSDQIQFLHDNPKERFKIGQSAQQWAKDRFTQKRYAREVIEILSEASGRPRSTFKRLEKIEQVLDAEMQPYTSTSKLSQVKQKAS